MKQVELQKAITDKVNKILDGMEYQEDFTIHIRAKHDELPTIHYDVTEFIIPEEVV